jgi:hypothetical protein
MTTTAAPMQSLSSRPAASPPAPRYTVLFRIPFRAKMTPRVTALLSRELDMFLTFDVKAPFPSANQSAGVARLDHFTGIHLFSGNTDDEWLLECRTYGSPSDEVAHAFRVNAARVARLLDPSVEIPARSS